jgi:tetratricopeptide (TPR) repeat protein
MMLALGLSLLSTVGSDSQLEAAKEQLFDAWTMHDAISQVTLGLPTEIESTLVRGMVEALQEEVIAATGSELTLTQRELDVPFMLGMLDGIAMEYSPSRASSCVQHLEDLDDAVSGIAASRIWRMRLRAAIILDDQYSASKAVRSLRLINEPAQEDLLAVALFEIQKSVDRGDLTKARAIYLEQDEILVKQNHQLLRGTLASGYARIAPTRSEALFGWFKLSSWYGSHGVQQREVDRYLLAQFKRLKISPSVLETSDDDRLAALAMRINMEVDLEAGRINDAMQRLLKLARGGDPHAAERILMHHENPVASDYVQEALEIVLSHPTQTNYPIGYWQLFAATREVQRVNYPSALAFLDQVPESSPYFERANRLTQQLNAIDVGTMMKEIQRTSISDLPMKVANIVETSTPNVIQELLRVCIDSWHQDGDISQQWLRPTVATLLEFETGVASSIRGEAYRLLGNLERAKPLFLEAIEHSGDSIQSTAGLADCTRDAAAMQRVIFNSSHSDSTGYWYWLSNVRLLQWHIEDGGQWTEAIAKINRLRRMDENLGGSQFAAQINALSQTR